MDFKIRKAITNEKSQIEDIAFRAYQKYIDVIGAKPAPMIANFSNNLKNDCIFVIEDVQKHQIVGYAVIVIKDNEYWLENIAVEPTKSKQGIGTQLISYVEDYISKSASEYQLYTNIKMHENVEWYKRIGFTELKRTEVEGFERVYFIKKLKNLIDKTDC